jgi:hypothetical protein
VTSSSVRDLRRAGFGAAPGTLAASKFEVEDRERPTGQILSHIVDLPFSAYIGIISANCLGRRCFDRRI